jgi:hypothetical protein
MFITLLSLLGDPYKGYCLIDLSVFKTYFIRRILVASNAVKTIDNEMINSFHPTEIRRIKQA